VECKVEIQKWEAGCYTLVHDKDSEFHVSALDVFLRLPSMVDNVEGVLPDETTEAGQIQYIDKESDEEECASVS